MLGPRLPLACFALAVHGCGAAAERGAVDARGADERGDDSAMRVLVTGFNDWRDIDSPEQLWRCRDNPSCRLLLGDETLGEPTSYGGPLVERLAREAPGVDWEFRTLPVTWGAFSRVPSGYDVIINIGLGVYDRSDALQLERGAFNLQQGADAAGVEATGPIDDVRGEGEVAMPPPTVLAKIDALAGRRIAGYEMRIADARSDNSFLCNETHWFALSALGADPGDAPREVYFLHIPHADDRGYEALAEGVAGVILELVD